MQEGLRYEIQRLILIISTLVILGFINGYMLETLFVGIIAYLVFTVIRIQKLYHWLSSDKNEMPPEMSGLWGDITDELYRYRQRIIEAKKNHTALALRIRQITSALDDGMVLLHADRTLDWWNPNATRLLNLRDQDKGEPISNLFRSPEFVRFIHSKDFSETLEIRPPHNTNLIYQFMAGSFGRGEIVLTVRDITRLRHLEEMRKEFVANISHELRTPLTVLVGYIETLQTGSDNLPPLWDKALLQMDQQTQRLSNLAEDLLMLSRLESTPPPLRLQKVDICAMLSGIIDSARVIASDDHLLTLNSQGNNLILTGENKELHSAFSNLIFNAIKHNPEGCDITVSAYRQNQNIIVEVSDTGVGIDTKHLTRLTERFYRADDSRTSSSGGTGLGLAIVKHVLARHSGEFTIDSSLGKGTTFTCTFKDSDQVA